ncbi:maltose O-acetyltransferase [Winogradskyella sp. PG-2]|nr:maltose O-acetyltransferase [Winogradskyella sp. PG-2]
MSFIYTRAFMMLRGLVKTRRKIFIDKRVKILNGNNFQFGKACTLERNVLIDCYSDKKIVFGNIVKIGAFSTISTTSHLSKSGIGLKIGNNSAIGEYSYFGCSGGVKIGNDVIMGQYVSFHSENHSFNNNKLLIREQGVSSSGIDIGNNIWVGSKATFLDGCKVGDNSVVAAGAVVNDIFPSNVLIGGVPAKIIKHLNA